MTAAVATLSTYRPSQLVDESEVGDRVVLYHRGTRTALVLNRTGAQVWRILAAGGDPQHVTQKLHETYPQVATEQIAADTAFYLRQLADNSVIERHG